MKYCLSVTLLFLAACAPNLDVVGTLETTNEATMLTFQEECLSKPNRALALTVGYASVYQDDPYLYYAVCSQGRTMDEE